MMTPAIGVNRAFEWCGGQVGVLNWWLVGQWLETDGKKGGGGVPCRP